MQRRLAEKIRESARHPRKADTGKEGAKQAHFVARKRPLTLKKERFDGFFLLFF